MHTFTYFLWLFSYCNGSAEELSQRPEKSNTFIIWPFIEKEKKSKKKQKTKQHQTFFKASDLSEVKKTTCGSL